jgi:hypothetical protein
MFFDWDNWDTCKKTAVSLAVTGFRLSQWYWDTGCFDWDRLGHFVPVALFGTGLLGVVFPVPAKTGTNAITLRVVRD